MSTGDGSRDPDAALALAAEQALALHATVAGLPDPALRDLVDLVLLALGERLGRGVGEEG